MSEEASPLKKASIGKNFIYNCISQILTLVIPFITTPYLARVLHETGNGQISFAMSIITYFTMFSNLGFNIYGQREIARVQNDRERKSKIFWEVFIVRCFFTVISLAVLYALVAGRVFDRNYSVLMLIMSLQVLAVIFDISYLYTGEENFKTIAIRSIFLKVLGLALVFLFVKTENDTWIYALCLSVSGFASNLLLWPTLFKHVKMARPSIKSIFKHLKPALIIFFPVAVTSIFTTVDKTMIGTLLKDSTAFAAEYENGCYEQAYKINSVAQTVTVLFSSVMMSRNAYDYGRGDIDAMNTHIYKSFRYVFMTSFLFCAGFLVLSNSFSAWFLGEGYASVPVLLQIMSARLIFSGLSVVLGDRFIVMGKELYWTIAVSAGAVLNLAINWLLIPAYGAVGAAVATAATEALIFAAFAIMSFNKKNLSGLKVLSVCWKYLLSAAASFGVMFIIQRYLGYSVWEFIVIGVAGAAAYACMLLMARDDFFIDIIKKFFNGAKHFFTRRKGFVDNKTKVRLNSLKQWRAGGVAFFGVRSFMWSEIRYRNPSERLQYKDLYHQMMRFKILCKLRKRLRKAADALQEEINSTDASLEHVQSNRIWIFWWQGMENAPEIVQLCYKSVLKQFSSTHEIVVITEKNYKEYVTLPERVADLWEKKKITVQFFSDLLRLQLLIRYGGTWMDATVLLTGEPPAYMWQSPLFLFQTLYPSTCGVVCRMESWFIHAESNNKILRLTYGLLLEYLRKKSVVCDYLLIFDMMELAIERYKKEWEAIPPCSNANSITLQNRMSWDFNEAEYRAILANTQIHKLDWRYEEADPGEKETYRSMVLKDFNS